MSAGKKKYYRYSGVQLDCAIAACAVVTIVATVLLFIDFNDNIRLCPVILGIAAIMDGILGIKFFKRKEKKKYIVTFVEAGVLLAASVVVLIALTH